MNNLFKGLILVILTSNSLVLFGQTIIEIRVASVYSDICDLDGFGQGDSDPYWEASGDDGQGNSYDFSHEISGTNDPGNRTINDAFFSHSYSGTPPSTINLSWQAFENDGSGGIPSPDGVGDTGVRNTSISVDFGASTGVWHNTNIQEAVVSGCSGNITWRITFQIKYDYPLPVELTCFKGQQSDGEVLLKWTTISEMNNFGFVVERSNDQIVFDSIGFMKSHFPSGNSNSEKQYTFRDKQIKTKSFYRLKQLDFDGKVNYSPVILVDSDFKRYVNLYPNPFEYHLDIAIQAEEAEVVSIRLYDMNGGIILSELRKVYLGTNRLTIDTKNIESGLYNLVIEDSNGLMIRDKVLRN